MKRRRNPIPNWVPWLIGAGALYYVWTKFLSPGSALNTAGNAVTTGIANLFPGTSSTAAISGSLTVLMPDGSSFPANNLTNLNFQTVNGQAQFTFNGALYALTPQVNGVYNAIAL
jgi:hypothetical protein